MSTTLDTELYTDEKDSVLRDVARVLAEEMNGVYPGDWEKNARDHLSPVRAQEQYDVLTRFVPDLTGKRVLEIGSSFGSMHALLRRQGVDAYAIEVDITRIGLGRRFWRVLAESPSRVAAAVGEALPFRRHLTLYSPQMCWNTSKTQRKFSAKRVGCSSRAD